MQGKRLFAGDCLSATYCWDHALSPASCDTNGNLTSNIQLQTFGGGGYAFAWSGPGIVGSTISNPITVSSTEQFSTCYWAGTWLYQTGNTIICVPSDTCELPACTCAVGSPSSSQNGPYCDNYTFTAILPVPLLPGVSAMGFRKRTKRYHQYSSPGVYLFIIQAGILVVAWIFPPIHHTVPAIADFTAAVTCNTVALRMLQHHYFWSD